jgi:hypothetical protein
MGLLCKSLIVKVIIKAVNSPSEPPANPSIDLKQREAAVH